MNAISTSSGLPLDGVPQAGAINPSEISGEAAGQTLEVPLDRTLGLDAHMRWLGKFLSEGTDVLTSWQKSGKVLIRCEFSTEFDYGEFSLSPAALLLPVNLGIPLEFCVRLQR